MCVKHPPVNIELYPDVIVYDVTYSIQVVPFLKNPASSSYKTQTIMEKYTDHSVTCYVDILCTSFFP